MNFKTIGKRSGKRRGFVRKALAALTVSSVLAFSAGATALAADPLPACNVEGCSQTQAHQHSGCTYAGHSLNDGHDYHVACTDSNCSETGVHTHDGVTCYGHSASGCPSGDHCTGDSATCPSGQHCTGAGCGTVTTANGTTGSTATVSQGSGHHSRSGHGHHGGGHH